MSSFRNIILDLGGVVLDISYERTHDAFIRLGFENFETVYSQLRQENVFDLFETGKITEDDFRNAVRKYSAKNLSDKDINAAWNAMILQLPEQRVTFLTELKSHHRLFLLSNTNSIHEKEFTRKIVSVYGKNILEELFEKIYYSHRLDMRKPTKEIFKLILNENNMMESETLFIDDSPQHVEGAKQTGMQVYLLKQGEKIETTII